jgi:hypothetical protein
MKKTKDSSTQTTEIEDHSVLNSHTIINISYTIINKITESLPEIKSFGYKNIQTLSNIIYNGTKSLFNLFTKKSQIVRISSSKFYIPSAPSYNSFNMEYEKYYTSADKNIIMMYDNFLPFNPEFTTSCRLRDN